MDHMTRTFAALALATLASAPIDASAPMPKPKATPAIHNTQTMIRKAQQKQHHAQAAMSAHQRNVARGGAHSDSESPQNPGGHPPKPPSGLGYGDGPPKP
jgi:hypothetical protein